MGQTGVNCIIWNCHCGRQCETHPKNISEYCFCVKEMNVNFYQSCFLPVFLLRYAQFNIFMFLTEPQHKIGCNLRLRHNKQCYISIFIPSSTDISQMSRAEGWAWCRFHTLKTQRDMNFNDPVVQILVSPHWINIITTVNMTHRLSYGHLDMIKSVELWTHTHTHTEGSQHALHAFSYIFASLCALFGYEEPHVASITAQSHSDEISVVRFVFQISTDQSMLHSVC